MSHVAITFTVLACVVVLFVSQRVAVELVAVGAALVLYATHVIDLNDAIAGFGDSTVVFIATLFVVSEGLDASGVVAWLGRELVERGGGNPRRLLVLLVLLVGVLTAFVTPNGSIAALMPVGVVMATRVRWPPSRMLLPAAFAAHAGSQLALTGSNVNVISSDAAADAHVGHFGFFDFALLGIPLMAGTVLITVLLGTRLLPDRAPRVLPPDFSDHARALLRQYRQDTEVFQLRLRPSSPLVGMPSKALELSDYPGVRLRGVRPQGHGSFVHRDALAAHDTLVLHGNADTIERLAGDKQLERWPGGAPEGVFDENGGLVEVIIPPRSGLIGQRIYAGMVTDSGDLVIVAVHRAGTDLDGHDVELRQGDTLLLQGTWQAFARNLGDPDVLVVDEPDLVRRQVVPMGTRGRNALLVLAGMIALLASGAVPPVVAGMLAAGAMILLRIMTIEQAYRGVSWTTVVLIAGMIPLSTAMTRSGAAEKLAHLLVDIVGDASPYLLVLGLCVLTGILGQLISNTATALIVIPIAVSAALDAGVSPRPLLMAVNVAAAASFLTPVATPANMMVMEPGGYRFGDYWKLGLPMMVLFIGVAVGLAPVFFPF